MEAQVYYADPHTHLPDIPPIGPALLHGVTEMVIEGESLSVEGWWQVPKDARYYEPLGSGVALRVDHLTAGIVRAVTFYGNIDDATVTIDGDERTINQWLLHLAGNDDDTITYVESEDKNVTTDAIAIRPSSAGTSPFDIGGNAWGQLVDGLSVQFLGDPLLGNWTIVDILNEIDSRIGNATDTISEMVKGNKYSLVVGDGTATYFHIPHGFDQDCAIHTRLTNPPFTRVDGVEYAMFPGYATAYFNYPVSASAFTVVCLAGGIGEATGSTTIIYATGSVEPTPTPTPQQVSTNIGDGINSIFPTYHAFGAEIIAGAILVDTSQAIEPEIILYDDDRVDIGFNYVIERESVTALIAASDKSLYYGDDGTDSFTLTHHMGGYPIVQAHALGDRRVVIDLPGFRYVDSDTVALDANYYIGPQIANFILADHSQLIGDGSATSFQVNNLVGHNDILIQLIEASSPYRYVSSSAVQIIHNSTSTFTVTFNYTPSSNSFRVIWADVRTQKLNLDHRFLRLDGSNHRLARGSMLNPWVDIWGRSVNADDELRVRLGTDGTGDDDDVLEVYSQNEKFFQLGLNANFWCNLIAGKKYSFLIGGGTFLRVGPDEVVIGIDTEITGDLDVRDVNARNYYGDISHTRYPPIVGGDNINVSFNESYQGVVSLDPRAIPSTPTPVPLEHYINKYGDVIPATSAGFDYNSTNIYDAGRIQARTVNLIPFEDATEAELKTNLIENDVFIWRPNGGPIVRLGVLYEGELQYQEMTLLASANPAWNYPMQWTDGVDIWLARSRRY